MPRSMNCSRRDCDCSCTICVDQNKNAVSSIFHCGSHDKNCHYFCKGG